MTRKRFIKRLMSEGYSRNTANELAWHYNSKGISYAEAYEETHNTFGGLCLCAETTERMAEAFRNFTETVQRVATAMSAGLVAFGQAYTASLEAQKVL